MQRTPMPLPALLLGLAATLTVASCAHAQKAKTTAPKAESKTKTEERDEDRRGGQVIYRWSPGDEDGRDRAVLGLSTASAAGKRDTLGVFVEGVTPGSPAEKAGIEEGDRIASINGVSLRLSPEDAGEPDMGGLMTRRLQREMGKVKAGDAVQLEVYSGGQRKSVRVPTVAADSLSRRRVRLDREAYRDRAVLGLEISATGSRRDTLGPLVTSVVTDGPAEKAGIVEGDRVSAINGVDLRVAREDAGDRWASGVKTNRFTRELHRLKAGESVELRVVSGGQTRTVRVTTAKASDVYKDQDGRRVFFGERAGGFFTPEAVPMPAIAPMPPMPPMPPMAPMPPMRIRVEGDGAVDVEALEEGMQRARETARASADAMRVRADAMRATLPLRAGTMYLRGGDGPGSASFVRGRLNGTLSGDGGTLALPGLRLSRVNADLASYFGAGSEGGLLVTSSEGRWSALHEGDVVVAVNGTPVRDGRETRISIDTRDRNEFEVLRKGKREKVTVEGDDR